MNMSDPMLQLRPSRLPPHIHGFEYVRELVRRNSAIVLDETKDYLIEARLAPLAAQQGLASVQQLIVSLRRQNPGKLHSKVVEALSTNETHFFRDAQPFRLFSGEVLPELHASNKHTRKLRIWSAACSTGQEPYSIAMSILDSGLDFNEWDVSILATDMNEAVLDVARAGRYRQLDVNRGLPARYLVKYFDRIGTEWRAKPEVMRLCDFRQVNLVRPWPALGAFDVVFLRNVLIYFDLDSKKAVLEKIAKNMKAGGHLYLGAAETIVNLSDKFKLAKAGAGASYRRNERV
jgi:chemotaxis protein methyltransferase CheR